MAGFEYTITVKQPVEPVFAFLTNGANNPKWELEMIESKPLTDGPTGVGAKWLYVRQFAGIKVKTVSEIIEYEPNRKWMVKSAMGPMPAIGTITFKPIEGGTELTFVLDVKTTGVFRLMDPMLESMLKKQSQLNLRKLKELLET